MILRFLLVLSLTGGLLCAGNFADGMKAFRSGQYKEAKNAFEKAVEEDGAMQAHYFLGLLYMKGLGTAKSKKAAKHHFQMAVQYGNARARCYLAEIYLKEHKKSRATALLKEGLAGGAQECEKIANKFKISL